MEQIYEAKMDKTEERNDQSTTRGGDSNSSLSVMDRKNQTQDLQGNRGLKQHYNKSMTAKRQHTEYKKEKSSDTCYNVNTDNIMVKSCSTLT